MVGASDVSDGLVLLWREALLKKLPALMLPPFQGGSSGKGTALRGKSDADLVVFLSPLTSFQEQFHRRAEFIQEIRSQLEAFQKQKSFTLNFEVQKPGVQNPRALGFTLKCPSSQAAMEFDVLPAYDVLGEGPRHELRLTYVKVLNEHLQ